MSTDAVRPGRSIFEVLLVLALLSIIAAVTLPWLQNARERSRQIRCQANLQQIAIGLQSHYDTIGSYPAGTLNLPGLTDPTSEPSPPATETATASSNPVSPEPASAQPPSDPATIVCSRPVGLHHAWTSAILPMIGRGDLFQAIRWDVGVYDRRNADVAATPVPTYLCPSTSPLNHPPGGTIDFPPPSSYAGNVGSEERPISSRCNGLLILNRRLTHDDIPDGIEHTLIVAEKLPLPDDLGWLSGTRATLRNGDHGINAAPGGAVDPCYVGGLGSGHAGGGYVLRGGGGYSFLSAAVDPHMLRQLTRRNDTLP